MLLRIRRSQSILEYAVLIAIVVAAIVIMQVFIKRGVSGRLKDSSDRISGGQLFSASNSTTYDHSEMDAADPRVITSMTATDDTAAGLATSVGLQGDNITISNIVGDKAYSAGGSSGGETTSTSQARMDDATKEAFTNSTMAVTADVTEFQDDFTSD